MQREIRRYFEIEARELIDRLTRGTARLESLVPGQPPDGGTLRDLQRAAHTLKGASHVVGELALAHAVHDFEDALTGYVAAPIAAAAAHLLTLVDGLAAAFAVSCTTAADGRSVQTPPATEEKLDLQPVRLHEDRPSAHLPPKQLPIPALTTTEAPADVTFAPTVRVDLAQTEQLLGHIAESTRLTAGLRDLMSADGSSQNQRLNDQLGRLERQLADLFRIGSQLRMVSTESLLLEAGRMVRASAAALDRRVNCVTQGGLERVDVRVLETLEAALLHLIRNAVAHGIEPIAERLTLGKPETATITIGVSRNGNEFRLTCADDGRGIDLTPIRAAAVRQGILAPGEAALAQPAQLLALLFRPGFTTSERDADQLSGRGIGLDAVRASMQALGGEVRVDTESGRGSTFTLIVPGTLFAVPTLEVAAAGQIFGLPLAAIEQTFLLAEHQSKIALETRQGRHGAMTLLLEQHAIPFLRLGDLVTDTNGTGPAGRAKAGNNMAADAPGTNPLESEPRRSGTDSPEFALSSRTRLTGVVLKDGSRRAALAVDSVAGTGDLLVRPLPDYLRALQVVAGAALGASGVPRLLLDARALIDLAEQGSLTDQRGAATPGTLRGFSATGLDPAPLDPILVIDDSATTRVLEQSILESEGYRVELATTAEEALAMARTRPYALFLVDVEMPGMNGFEFVELVRADAQLSRTPSIMVTSLDSAESRARGRAAGAESYIVKGEFNQRIYLDRIRALIGVAR